MLCFARKFGFGAEFIKNIRVAKAKLGYDEPNVEDMTKEINAGTGPSATRASRRSA
jgi:formate dehydrogenase major subunit